MIETDVQRLVFQHQGVTLCSFRCPADHARWRGENRIQDGHNVAFPKAFVEIQPAGECPVLVDPNQVIYYNHGDRFHRRLVRRDGDAGNVFLFAGEHLVDALEARDPAVVDRPDAPFRIRSGPVDPSIHLRQRLIFDYADRCPEPDPVRFVEASLELLEAVLATTYEPLGTLPRKPRKASTRAGHRQQVEEIKRQLATRFTRPIGLDQLARGADLSVYHMCRIFRRQTGLPLYRYVRRLRLRMAVDLLMDSDRSLSQVALEVGFAHQSHFHRGLSSRVRTASR